MLLAQPPSRRAGLAGVVALPIHDTRILRWRKAEQLVTQRRVHLEIGQVEVLHHAIVTGQLEPTDEIVLRINPDLERLVPGVRLRYQREYARIAATDRLGAMHRVGEPLGRIADELRLQIQSPGAATLGTQNLLRVDTRVVDPEVLPIANNH